MFYFLPRPLIMTTLAFILACIPSILFGQEVTPPFQFDSAEPITLQWDSFTKEGADVVILSNVGIKRTLNVQVSDIELKMKDGSTVRNSVQPQDASVDLQTIAKIHLRLPPDTNLHDVFAPATYDGYLLLTDQAAHITIHRPIQLVIPGPAKASGVQVTSWSATAYRYAILARLFPSSTCDQWVCVTNAALPVAAPSADKQLKGILTGESGGMAVAWTNGQATDMPMSTGSPYETIKSVPLHFDYLDRPGVFSGKLAVNAEAKDQQTDLEVLVTHDPLLPIIALVLGGAAAIMTKQYSRNKRKKLELRRDIEALKVAAADAVSGMDATVVEHRFRGYTICDDLAAQQKELVQQIELLPRLAQLDNDNPIYKQIREDLNKAKAAITTWSEFPAALDQLELSLHDVVISPSVQQRLTAIVPGETKREPAFLQKARGLLHGQPIKLKEVPGRSSAITSAAQFATSWNKLEQQVWLLHDKLKEIERQKAPKLYDEAAGKVSEAYHELWRASAAEELADWRTEADLRRAEQIVDQLSCLPDRQLLDISRAIPSSGLLLQLHSSMPSHDTSPGEVVAQYNSAIRRWDSLFAAIIIIIAVLTGLQTLYFGKSFGTVVNYIGVIVWAFGATALLDGIIEALDRVLMRLAPDVPLPRIG